MMHLGFDFGTTNSALALCDDAGNVELASFASDAGPVRTFRSILFFDTAVRAKNGRPAPFAGPRAIEKYLTSDGTGRLVQSLKSHVASRLFTKTSIFGRIFTIEDLVAELAGRLRAEVEATRGPLGRRAVVGRPVRFAAAENDEDDRFGQERLRAGLAQAGFDEVTFEYEPVGAAYHYQQSLDHDELVLIADFGGGTSDFCLVRVGPTARRAGRTRQNVLGTDGVAIAGDAFDGTIVSHVVAPMLGLGSRYRLPFSDHEGERTMEIPSWIYGKLRRWHHLSFLKSKETMELLHDLRRQSLEPHKIEALIHVVESDLGFHLYRAVERTKIGLAAETAKLVFDDPPFQIDQTLHRTELEQWMKPSLDAIGSCVDRILGKCNVTARDVDRVFLTGGSSLVPSVRALFASRFGDDKLSGGDELTSIALGLALRARDLA